MERLVYILINIIMETLYVAGALLSVFIATFFVLLPFYLMVCVNPWFILIYIAYIIFLIFIYLLIKNK